MLGNVDECACLGLLRLTPKSFLGYAVDEVIRGTDIMDAYGFLLDLGEKHSESWPRKDEVLCG